MIRKIIEAIDDGSISDEAKELIREYWNAKESYEFYASRGEAMAIKASSDRMNRAVALLRRMGFFDRRSSVRMPSLDELGD